MSIKPLMSTVNLIMSPKLFYPPLVWGFFLLILCHCAPSAPKNEPSPSPQGVEESFENLKIMSTPPQKWELNISTGQRKNDSTKAQDIDWNSPLWEIKSPLAIMKDHPTKSVFVPQMVGVMQTPVVQIRAENTSFDLDTAELKGEVLKLSAPENQWSLTAEYYQSNYPWSQFKLHQVKGTFSR